MAERTAEQDLQGGAAQPTSGPETPRRPEAGSSGEVPPRAEAVAGTVVPAGDEPPVVARLVVEIRSDGSRTIARGAFEDQVLGQRMGIEAEGATPTALALSLARTIMRLPLLSPGATARRLVRSLLPGRGGRGGGDPRGPR